MEHTTEIQVNDTLSTINLSDTPKVDETLNLDKNFEVLYGNLVTLIGNNILDSKNIINIVINLMKIVEDFPSMSGYGKKMLVIKVLKFFINKISYDNADILDMFVDRFLPSIIDEIISIDKNKIIINAKSRLQSCEKACLTCICM